MGCGCFFSFFFLFLGFFRRNKPCVCELPCTMLPSLSLGCLRAVGHWWAGICLARAGFPNPRGLISHWAVTPSTFLSSTCCPGHHVPHEWPQRSPSGLAPNKMEANPPSPALSLRTGCEGETAPHHSLAFPFHQPGFGCGLEHGEVS